MAAGFELDALLVMATVAPRDLVKTLMDIDWAPDTAGKSPSWTSASSR